MEDCRMPLNRAAVPSSCFAGSAGAVIGAITGLRVSDLVGQCETEGRCGAGREAGQD